MFPLLETVIAFAAIMLMLTILVKSLADFLKHYLDYWVDHVEAELGLLLRKHANKALGEAGLNPGQIARLGEEYFTPENVKVLLAEAGANKTVAEIKADVEQAKATVKYFFARRMNNLSLACGLGLCLFLNVNAITIWGTLYSDQQVRAKFSEPKYVDALLKKSEELEKAGTTANQTKEDLEKEKAVVKAEIDSFRSEVNFGVGKIWSHPETDPAKTQWFYIYEFFGSLLTGLLVSAGAPYWHDLLRNLSELRKKP